MMLCANCHRVDIDEESGEIYCSSCKKMSKYKRRPKDENDKQ